MLERESVLPHLLALRARQTPDRVLAGALDSPACEKAAHVVSLCDAFGLTLIYFVDVPGFLVGAAAERSGLARRSGRLLYDLGQATVPRFSVVLRKGYGLASSPWPVGGASTRTCAWRGRRPRSAPCPSKVRWMSPTGKTWSPPPVLRPTGPASSTASAGGSARSQPPPASASTM